MDLKFKQSNIKILESVQGDLMILDPRFGIEMMVTAELLDHAKTDDAKKLHFGRQFVNFLNKQIDARWQLVICDLAKIYQHDEKFFADCQPFVLKRNFRSLRKLEKDIFFWFTNNNQNNKFKINTSNDETKN